MAESPPAGPEQTTWGGSQLSLLQARRPWISLSTFLALGFPICKVGRSNLPVLLRMIRMK